MMKLLTPLFWLRDQMLYLLRSSYNPLFWIVLIVGMITFLGLPFQNPWIQPIVALVVTGFVVWCCFTMIIEEENARVEQLMRDLDDLRDIEEKEKLEALDEMCKHRLEMEKYTRCYTARRTYGRRERGKRKLVGGSSRKLAPAKRRRW